MPPFNRARSGSRSGPSHITHRASPLSHSQLLTPFDNTLEPSSRFSHNLKVLRRHDPSIDNIFHQFTFVCLYHYNGPELGWEKRGCEGSMFLFERHEHPKYGFFILNRTGTGDYIQRMSPSDNIEVTAKYLMYRAYSESHQVVGLWSHSDEERTQLARVMTKLHQCIKDDVPYPHEWKAGVNSWTPPDQSSPNHLASNPDFGKPSQEDPSDQANGTLIDALFAKIAPPSTQSSQSPYSISQPTAHPSEQTSVGKASSQRDRKGLALLDQLLNPTAPPPITEPTPPPAPPIIGRSRFGSPETRLQAPRPQALTTDVMQMLLGFPPRSESAASSVPVNPVPRDAKAPQSDIEDWRERCHEDSVAVHDLTPKQPLSVQTPPRSLSITPQSLDSPQRLQPFRQSQPRAASPRDGDHWVIDDRSLEHNGANGHGRYPQLRANGNVQRPSPRAANLSSKGTNGLDEAKKGGLDRQAGQDSVIGLLSHRPLHVVDEEDAPDKNEFARRLMELIHTDKQFMVDLHQEYLRRLG